LLAVSNYTSACITEIAFVGGLDSTTILTAATDGHLALWTAPEEILFENRLLNPPEPCKMNCIGIQPIHQNSVKDMSTWSFSQKTTLVLTSGDDNSLGVALIRTDMSSGALVISALIVPRAHAAAINAARLYSIQPVGGGDSLSWVARAATAGNDQTLKLWDIEINLVETRVEGVSVKRVAKQYSVVADISSMSVFPVDGDREQRRLLLCGVGMEVWEIAC
jgi:WD40 repeat protein